MPEQATTAEATATARVKVIDAAGEVVEVETTPEVAAVLQDAGPRPKEIPFTDCLGRCRRRRDAGTAIDPDTLGVYVVPHEAMMMRPVLDRMLTHYHDDRGRPVEVLAGYRAAIADTGAQPKEATVTAYRLAKDRSRLRAWDNRSKGAGAWRGPTQATTVRDMAKLAGGTGTAGAKSRGAKGGKRKRKLRRKARAA